MPWILQPASESSLEKSVEVYLLQTDDEPGQLGLGGGKTSYHYLHF